MTNNSFFDDLLKNTPFGSMKPAQTLSPFSNDKEEKKEEPVKEPEQQIINTDTDTVEAPETKAKDKAKESVNIAPNKNTTNEDSSDDTDDNEDTSEANDEEESPREEEPKKKRRKRRTKAEMEEAKRAEELSNSVQESDENSTSVEKVNDVKEEFQEQQATDNKSVGSNYKKVDINVVKEYLAPNIEDPEWDEQVEYIEKELAKLKKFDSEINEGSIRIMVPLYANLGLYVAPMRSEYKAMLAILEDKDSGLISYQKAVNAIGTNEATRKTKAFESCGNYKVAGMKNPIDLIDYTHLIRYRYEYLDGVMQQIDIAKSALISFLTVISKIEK